MWEFTGEQAAGRAALARPGNQSAHYLSLPAQNIFFKAWCLGLSRRPCYGPTAMQVLVFRALASARGSVARRAQRPRRKPLEGPKGPRVAKTRESEGPRTSKAQCLFWRLPVLLYVFHDSAKNRDFRGTI